MITALITLGSIAAYLAVVLVTAKVTYGRVYREELSKYEITKHADAYTVRVHEESARGQAAPEAFWMGILWPVTLPGYVLIKSGFWICRAFITRPVRPPANLRAWEQAQKIKNLEAEVSRLEKRQTEHPAPPPHDGDLIDYADEYPPPLPPLGARYER